VLAELGVLNPQSKKIEIGGGKLIEPRRFGTAKYQYERTLSPLSEKEFSEEEEEA